MYSRNIIIAIAALLAVFIFSCDGDTDFKGLYTEPEPPQMGETKTFECKSKPDKGTEWNTVSEYIQTWDGTTWQPPETETVYNEYPSTTSCQYKCAMPYISNGYGACVEDPNPNNKYKLYKCPAMPDGEGYEWNTVSEYWQQSTDQGYSYYPVDDLTTEYNLNSSTTSCQYKCTAGYSWNGTVCTTAASKVFNCNPLPDDSGAYVWNTVSSYSQESSDGGITYSPADDSTTEYNETGSTTSCQFKCAENYTWDGTRCFAWQDAAGYYWYKKDAQPTYNEAAAYCSSIGGSIPSIDQIRFLIQNCTDTVTGGACTVTTSCTTWASCKGTNCDGCSESYGYYSVLSDSGWFWSSTLVSDQTNYVFTVNFDTGGISMASIADNGVAFIRCIKN